MNLIRQHRVRLFTYLPAVLSIFLASHLTAQPLHAIRSTSADSLDYFPLSVGNRWTYGWSLDTNYKTESLIVDTARINGRLYYLHLGHTLSHIGKWPLLVDSLRVDSLHRIWRYEKAQEYMLFDFWHGNYPSYTTYPSVDTVRVTSNVGITVPAGYFANCVDLYFPRSFVDESVGYVFAPGIGIVRYYGPFIGKTDLLRGVVNGKFVSSIDGGATKIPTDYVLDQNYPNPFNPTTTITYELPKASMVNVSVFDILGQEVLVLVNERRNAGIHEVTIDARGLSSGVYVYRMQAGDFLQTRKLVLLK